MATPLIDDIEKKLESLLHTPDIGAPREQLGAGPRVIFHPPYALYYLATASELIVVRVLHEARDTATISDPGGFKT